MDALTIAGRTFHSRLIVGTGKYASHVVMRECHEESGAEMVADGDEVEIVNFVGGG